MTRMNAKTVTALVGTMALTASAFAGTAPALADNAKQVSDQAPQSISQQQSNMDDANGAAKTARVQGTFSFDQGVLTSTADITTRFSKAAASLCANMPTYLVSRGEAPIAVGGDVDNGFSATLSEMADQEGTESYELACSCASNGPGGGAIANAEVEGVSLASIANLAKIR